MATTTTTTTTMAMRSVAETLLELPADNLSIDAQPGADAASARLTVNGQAVYFIEFSCSCLVSPRVCASAYCVAAATSCWLLDAAA